MLIIFLKLILAHLLGDFVFQTKSMVIKRKTNVWYLLLHIVIHSALLFGLLWPSSFEYWEAIAFIAIAHLAIDSSKIWLEDKFPNQSLLFFSIDQILHLSVIIGVVCFIFGVPQLSFTNFQTVEALLYLIVFLLIVGVSPVLLRIFFLKWERESEFKSKGNHSLLDAGMIIGIMERLMIVLFIQVNFLEGIGFLLAAKSIFRFGDLANAKDTKYTEYILVGTLASFIIAIIIGFGLRILLQYI